MSQPSTQRKQHQRPLRLLHLSDLHLEDLPSGLTEIPEHLRERLLNCPYDAAAAAFDFAITEQVDAVLLAGDVADLALAGPRGIVFLRDQFARLQTQQIPVYWVGGTVDPPDAWPPGVSLPPNVHVFPKAHSEGFSLSRDGQPLAHIVGISRSTSDAVPLDRLVRPAGEIFTIGVAYGKFEASDLPRQKVDYLALGGRHHRKTFSSPLRTAHYAGTPQGRSPLEPGPRGATLVSVDETGEIKPQFVPLDTVRWQVERLEVEPRLSLEAISEAMRARVGSLIGKTATADMLVVWDLEGSGPALHAIRTEHKDEALLVRLRDDFGHQSPCAWSVEIRSQIARPLPKAWFEQETILGDVLREIQTMSDDPSQPMALVDYLAASDRNGELAPLAALPDAAAREHLLQRTADLCVDLLTVEEQHKALAKRHTDNY